MSIATTTPHDPCGDDDCTYCYADADPAWEDVVDPKWAEQSGALRYVNAYAVTQHYGGPEEGGWWYRAGEPIASVPCTNDSEVNEQRARLLTVFDDVSEGDISSVLGGTQLLVTVERGVAAEWPEETPHYE
jgi:hypothetical protein